MFIIDLLEDLQKHGEDNIEFYLAEDIDGGEMTKLEVFICDGKYLYTKHEKDGKVIDNVIVLGLVRAVDAPPK
jgi:hypothetical protein